MKKTLNNIKVVPVILLALLSTAFFTACSIDDSPLPVQLGKEDCAACQMTLMEGQFACEYITDKGKCLKFDDLSCLFNYLAKNNIADKEVLKIYVGDYQHPENLIDLKTATLVLGVDIQSPMGGGVAAFSDKDEAIRFAEETKSSVLDSWTRLKKGKHLEEGMLGKENKDMHMRE